VVSRPDFLELPRFGGSPRPHLHSGSPHGDRNDMKDDPTPLSHQMDCTKWIKLKKPDRIEPKSHLKGGPDASIPPSQECQQPVAAGRATSEPGGEDCAEVRGGFEPRTASSLW